MRWSLLPGLCFLGMLVMATVPGSAQKIVLSIDGNWWDSNGQGLGFASRVNGPCVFGDGGLLQVADAGTKAAETFTYDKMTSACPSSCTARPSGVPASAHCHDATVPPPRPASSEQVCSRTSISARSLTSCSVDRKCTLWPRLAVSRMNRSRPCFHSTARRST